MVSFQVNLGDLPLKSLEPEWGLWLVCPGTLRHTGCYIHRTSQVSKLCKLGCCMPVKMRCLACIYNIFGIGHDNMRSNPQIGSVGVAYHWLKVKSLTSLIKAYDFCTQSENENAATGWRKLQHVILRQNRDREMGGSTPKELGNMPYLKEFIIPQNGSPGSLPIEIVRLTRVCIRSRTHKVCLLSL